MTLYSYVTPYTGLAAATFGGNPNRTISAINTSGGIVCSRTSGQTPCFIHTSASAITATGTDLPWEDLSYSWDFGDVSGTETFTNPGVGGGTVNANDDQRGPEAVYCYRSAGTYTITLTIRGKNGTSPFKSTTVTQEITVSAYSASGGEYWFDSVSGSDSNDGLSDSAPKQTLSALNTLLGTANRKFNIKRGSTYDGSVALNIGATTQRIDAYGSGDKPVFNVSSGTDIHALRLQNGSAGTSSAKDDVVVSNITFSTSGTATGIPTAILGVGHATATVRRVYLDNCDLDKNTDAADGNTLIMEGNDMAQIGLWNCSLSANLDATMNTNGGYFHAGGWFFVIGGYVTGGNDPTSLDREHHLYINVKDHVLVRWVDFRDGPNRNYCINGNWDHEGVSLPEYAQYHLYADCGVTGTLRFHDLGENLNDISETRFKNVVTERCKIHGLDGEGVVYFFCAETYTMRDHEIWACDGGNFLSLDVTQQGGVLKTKVYRNKHHRPATAVAGNIFAFASSSWTVLQEWTDNITVDLRTAAQIAAIPFTQQTGALIDRNQYYAPNDSDAEYLRDVTTTKTFAEWQAAGFDTNGSVADPGWTDAANGNFS